MKCWKKPGRDPDIRGKMKQTCLVSIGRYEDISRYLLDIQDYKTQRKMV